MTIASTGTSGASRATELTAGLGLAAALLGALSVTVGLSATGWVAGGGVALVTAVLLDRGLRDSGSLSLGPANAVTYGRSLLVAGVAAVTASRGPAPVLVALGGVALALDGVDGMVARATASASALGARFDMEVDAFLLLVLCIALTPAVGAWVLVIGLLRYGFVAAGVLVPWLAAPLPARFSRKVVAAAQGVVLVAAVSGVLAPAATAVVLGCALAALCWSFGRDVAWLAVRR